MLTNVESLLLGKLLEGDHPTLAALRRQATAATAGTRTRSPVGVNTALIVGGDTAPVTPSNFDITDVAFQFRGAENSGHAVLMVRDGVMQELMAYNWTDEWPLDAQVAELDWVKYLAPGASGLEMQPSDNRDLQGLARELAA